MSEHVLVIGDDLQTFLAVARSLGRRGMEVHAAPSNFAAPALKSRFVTACHRLPPYPLGAGGWEAALRQLVETHDFKLVVPTSDAGLMMLHHHAEALGRDRLAIPNPQAVKTFSDKGATRQLAEALGVPMAGGQLLSGEEDADELAERLGLPLVLKPRSSYILGSLQGKRYARIIRSRTELAEALGTGGWRGNLAESFFPGVGVGLSVLARDGRILQAYQHRRLQQGWDTGPSTSRVSETVEPRLLAAAEALTAATALQGVAMFEFRLDPANGEHILIEVNPRFWGSLPLAIEAGADFPAAYYDLIMRRSEPAAAPYRTGVRKADLTGEYHRLADGFHQARGAVQKTFALVLALTAAPALIGRRGFDSWAKDDQAPLRAERRELARMAAAAVAKRLPARRLRAARRFRSALRQLSGKRSPNLVVVARASVCRSRFTEQRLRWHLENLRSPAKVSSAILYPWRRLQSHEAAQAAARRFGVDLQGDNSVLTLEQLQTADMIFVFEPDTELHLREIFPDSPAAILQLSDLWGDVEEPRERDVAGALATFERIEAGVSHVAAQLAKGSGDEEPGSPLAIASAAAQIRAA